jgi:SAM-dependent methyltransferase
MNPHFVPRKSCPVCDGTDLKELYRTPFAQPPLRPFLDRSYFVRSAREIDWSMLDDADYVLSECRSCTLIFQVFVPDDFLWQKIDEEWSDPEKALHRRERNIASTRGQHLLEVMRIADFFGKPPEQLTVLDFGMGWGFWIAMAQALGCRAYGVEISQARVAHAVEHGVEVIPFDDVAPASLDFINTEQVFEHLPQPYEIASRLAEALRPGGILRISVPNGSALKRRLRSADWTASYGSRQWLGAAMPFQHISTFNHRALVTLGERAGLSPVRVSPRLRYRYAPYWQPLRRVIKRSVGQHIRAMQRKDTDVWFRRPGNVA